MFGWSSSTKSGIEKYHGIKVNTVRLARENKKNPFDPIPHKVLVKDIKNGWVRYAILYKGQQTSCSQNESETIATFLYLYPTEVSK